MARTVSIGAQCFADMRENDYFYVDKTDFVRRWWESADKVTLVCRPRRFGKTLALSTVESFFSCSYAGRGEELFGGLDVWDYEGMRALQGTVPVISVSFAKVKERDLEGAMATIRRILRVAVDTHCYLRDSSNLAEGDRAFLDLVSDDMDDATAADCLGQLCSMLEKHWGTKPIVLLDEYDTPMQEAWLGGYWDDIVSFMRSLFNATFKTNAALGRALITGVTRVSRESIFSDLNNLTVVTTTSNAYEDCFGFTEAEVFAAMDEFGMGDREGVRLWYDGFTFGDVTDIYNPWSITNYLNTGRFQAWWMNSSGNGLVSSLVRTGDEDLKADFETLLQGGSVTKTFDEQVVFSDLDGDPGAVWSLLLASGYLKVLSYSILGDTTCELALTNREVRMGFDKMVRGWFSASSRSYNGFAKALLAGDLKVANIYLNDVTFACVSSFDAGTRPGRRSEPERFYHGLVLGLLVDLRDRYSVESNRESGFGRYDVTLVPLGPDDPALVIEFKVFDPDEESDLSQTVARAHAQVREKGYVAGLVARGIEPDRIREYGIAFEGKRALVG